MPLIRGDIRIRKSTQHIAYSQSVIPRIAEQIDGDFPLSLGAGIRKHILVFAIRETNIVRVVDKGKSPTMHILKVQ